MLNTVYTIGHSTNTIEDFIANLNRVNDGNTFLVDVRSVPYSAHTPQFNKDLLKQALKEIGIRYVHMGDEFGARRSEAEAYNDKNQVDFNKTEQLAMFQKGLQRVKKALSLSCNLIFMCSERNPLECHRFGLVARALSKQGILVNHIIGNKIISQAEAESELLIKYQSMIDSLFASHDEQLDQAYEILNTNIGYKK